MLLNPPHRYALCVRWQRVVKKPNEETEPSNFCLEHALGDINDIAVPDIECAGRLSAHHRP